MASIRNVAMATAALLLREAANLLQKGSRELLSARQAEYRRRAHAILVQVQDALKR
jgi:hypothetical protein